MTRRRRAPSARRAIDVAAPPASPASVDPIAAALPSLPHPHDAELKQHVSAASLASHDLQPPASPPAPAVLAPPRRRGARAAKSTEASAAQQGAPTRQPTMPPMPEAAPSRPADLPREGLVAAPAALVEVVTAEAPRARTADQPSVAELDARPATAASQATLRKAPPVEAQPAAAATDLDPVADSFDAATRNLGKLIEFSGKAAAAYLKPREAGTLPPGGSEEVSNSLNAIGRVFESWVSNPARMIQAQAALSTQIMGVWGDTVARFTGKGEADQAPAPARKVDRRFAAPEWRETPLFDFLHQAYLTTTDWAKAMVVDAENIDEATRERAAFYLRQISSAVSPSNFLATNPELIKETFKQNGENLVRGMQMLAEDIAAGGGEVKIRQSDPTKFKLGIDMASTPGKVIFRNEIMELIQYSPATPEVLERPLLIVPPWINKFYVLDLNREKSLIGWAVSQGLTVFVISWVNPDERHAAKDWNAYMGEGIFAALDAIEQAIGVRDVATVGYCVGGTLLAATLAYMARTGDRRVSAATFLTTQVDFQEAGDLKVFADEAQIRVLEREMKKSGYLPGAKMANAFNMLRPDELIWSYATNAYLKGQAPGAFDLLAWNSDSTRMTAANHAFYLRNCYLENRLAMGEMVIGGERVNLGEVSIPIYDLATKEDHIAPARSVFKGAHLFGGPVRYVVAGSGHIAGVVNPPSKAKYQFWSGGRMDGSFEEWFASAQETKGTWWPDWFEWLRAQRPATVPARTPGAGGLPALTDAPGDYVREKS